MKKTIIMILLLLVLIQPIKAYTEIQWSLDNSTFYHAAYTNNNSITLEELDNGIDATTKYYFRIRHIYDYGNSDWVYVSTYTDEGSNTMIIAAIILLPMILGMFFLVGAVSLGQDHTVIKIFLFLLSILTFFVSFHAGLLAVIEFFGFTELQDFIGSTTYWVGIIFAVIVTYFIIYAIWQMFDSIARKKKEELEY